MKLKTILNEVSKVNSAFYYVFNRYIPVTVPLIKRLGKSTKKIAFHITDVDHIPNLLRLEGKSKAISTFNAVGNYQRHPDRTALTPLTGRGMWTEGGVFVVLSGIVLAESWENLWTEVDKQGRRWIPPNTKHHRELSQMIVNELPPKVEDHWGHDYDAHHYWDSLTNQQRKDFVGGYIETAYRIILKNKSWFREKFFQANQLKSDQNWNELVLSKIKVERIYILDDLFDDENEWKKKGEWALKHYKNTERTQLKKLPSIIKKWGGSVRLS